jgi:TP901-1 family phage major tail protein
MATTGIINGSTFLVYVEDVAIAHATSHSLSVTMATRNATTKDNAGWSIKLAGVREWSVTGEGLIALDATYGVSELFTVMTNRTVCTVKFSTEVSGDEFWGGEAVLTSLQLDAPMEDNGTYSFTFEGASLLTQYSQT